MKLEQRLRADYALQGGRRPKANINERSEVN